jgi:hypothetical protein
MSAKPSPRLPLHTVEDMFDKLKFEETRLLESWSVYDSFNFIVTAHHLYYDWILCGKASTKEQTERAKGLPADAQTVFQAIIDISNGSKHWELDNKKSIDRQVVAEVTEPMCAGWDSYFLGDMVFFRFGAQFVSMAEISSLVMAYFEWVIFGEGKKTLDELSDALAAMKVP